MKAIISMLLLTLSIQSALAAKVEDVKILDMKYSKNSYKLKLQVKEPKDNAYFYVDIIKEDEKAFEKLALVLLKLNNKNSFKLNLDIPSFSAWPSGAYYRSTTVIFEGNPEGKSLIIP